MNRRDFFLLRRDPIARVVELSCRRLYMRCLDALVTDDDANLHSDTPDPWGNEPPAVWDRRTTADIFDGLAVELRGADVLRLVDRQWVEEGEMSRQLDRLLEAFRVGGGRVEMVDSMDAPAS